MQEIERKFLVKNTNFLLEAPTHFDIAQGYLNSDPNRAVRIRLKGEKAYITIKGISDHAGLQRFEWEKQIPVDEAKMLLNLCEEYIIYKTRYLVNYNNQCIEVDIFKEKNDGLILAEIELETPDQIVEIPDWLGDEVTGNEKYYNVYLSKNPYTLW